MPKKTELKCYFGCPVDGPLHRFPKWEYPHEDRFISWKSVLSSKSQKYDNNYIYNNVRLCYRHFAKYFQLPSNHLTRNAVPTLHLSIPEGLQDQATCQSTPIEPQQAVDINNPAQEQVQEPTTATVYNLWKQEEKSSEDEYTPTQPRNKRGYYEALRDFDNDDDSSQSNKRKKEENCRLIPTSSIKIESEDEESEGAGQQSEAVEDLWHFFEKLPPNRARCILCKETLSRDSLTLTQHINEKHRKVALNLPSDSDDDQRDVYTEVVYLEDEQPIDSSTIRVKSTKNYQEGRLKKRRLSSRTYEDPKCRVQKVDSEPRTEVKDDADEEIENFGRYVIGLLKKLPKDVCTQLQLDIINMVMKAKLKVSAPPEPVNVTVSSIQDGVVFTPVSVSSANVIVTTASDGSYSGQNVDSSSMPSIEFVVENDKES